VKFFRNMRCVAVSLLMLSNSKCWIFLFSSCPRFIWSGGDFGC